MSFPKNPDTIILKNMYYPNGITEKNIWDYYQRYKNKLLDQVSGREIFFILFTDLNKSVVVRNNKLTKSNYDKVITGRTVSIHSTMRRKENIAIIDIDCDIFSKAKDACKDCYNFVSKKINIVKYTEIRFTGKTSFHIVCHLNSFIDIDTIRFIFKKYLTNSDLSDKYTILSKRKPGIPNLDLAPDKYKGGFITLYSLSEFGLKCLPLDYLEVSSFSPDKARIF